jgi:hypothetical protein
MHAEKCPVCGGKGRISDIAVGSGMISEDQMRTCHGCKGKGWVEVRDYEFGTMPDPIKVDVQFKDDPRKYFTFGCTMSGVPGK